MVGDFRRRSSVTKMLQRLGGSTLQERRTNARLIMLHKITPMAHPSQQNHRPLFASASRRTRAAHEHKFKQLTPSTTVRVPTVFFPAHHTGLKLHCFRSGIKSFTCALISYLTIMQTFPKKIRSKLVTTSL